MAVSGYQAEQNLEKAITDFAGKFICVIEGALPRGLNGKYLTLGPKGKTGIQVAKEVTSKAAAVVCIGACSVTEIFRQQNQILRIMSASVKH